MIQTPWMRNLAKEISKDSAWSIDSTFKTNKHGLLLYAAMCPNKQGVGMPVFFILCSANVGSNHESVALKLILSAIFKSMDEVLPNAIVIDRSWTEHNAFREVIDHDEWCWENGSSGGTQTKCKLLLCWFYVKKAWTKNLLPKVKEEKRSELYAWMDRLMFCNSELQFNATYESFKKHMIKNQLYFSM